MKPWEALQAKTVEIAHAIIEHMSEINGNACTPEELGAIIHCCRQAQDLLAEVKKRLNSFEFTMEQDLLRQTMIGIAKGDRRFMDSLRWSDEHGDFVANVKPKLVPPSMKKADYPEIFAKLADLTGLSELARETECFRIHYPGFQEWLARYFEEHGELPFNPPDQQMGGSIRITRKAK